MISCVLWPRPPYRASPSPPFIPFTASASSPAANFQLYKDANDGYQFAYPFGWQEVAVTGQDVVFKVCHIFFVAFEVNLGGGKEEGKGREGVQRRSRRGRSAS